jgi:type I restriction enzyme R subunit
MTADIPFHLFDRQADLRIVQRRLPHWSQAGTVCFVTWRTHDSMPRAVLEEWHDERRRWLRFHGIDPTDLNWRQRLAAVDSELVRGFLSALWNGWHDALDACHGDCVLRRPALAEIVASSLRYFDGDRYVMFDFVVMPNHVHLLASFLDEESMLAQCEAWKHYTATRINRLLNRRGRFWQQDGFDHLVRSEEQFEFLRRYIKGNAKKAGLPAGEFVHYTKVVEGLQSP